jgi:hypothetical protein
MLHCGSGASSLILHWTTVEGMCLTSYIGTRGGILKYFLSG